MFFILLHWNSINIPFGRDQGAYAYSAWLLRSGIAPYANSFEQKPPMIIYTYALAQLIGPHSYWPPRVFACLFMIFTTAMIGFMAEREFGRGSGLMAAWMAVRMTVMPNHWGIGANTEVFMLLPLVSVMALYIWKKGNADRWHWFFAGVLSSLALLYKPICLLVLLFVFAVWLAETLNAKSLRIAVENGFFALSGMVLASVIVLSYFIFHNCWGAIWNSVVMFNYYYGKMDYRAGLQPLFDHLKVLWSQWWILFLLFAWFLIKRPVRWWFYLGSFFASLITIYQDPNGGYYLLLTPFLALISVMSINALVDQIKLENKILIRAGFVFVVILLMTWPIRQQLLMNQGQLAIYAYGRGNPFIESPVVAEYVKAMTSPEDHIFIAGSEPQILYYAERMSPTRFITVYPLMINTPFVESYQKEAIRELEARPPKLIVYIRSPYSWLLNENSPGSFLGYLDGLLKKKYSPVAGFIQSDNIGYWQKMPISVDKRPFCSLLVFKKI